MFKSPPIKTMMCHQSKQQCIIKSLQDSYK